MQNGCCYKYKLAEKLEVSRRTLAYWINTMYYDHMLTIGYKKHQKYLTPEQLKYLSNKLGFELD